MARRPAPMAPARRIQPTFQPKLEDRVDKIGEAARRGGPGEAARYMVGAQEDAEDLGWWYYDGDEWAFYGNEDPPEE